MKIYTANSSRFHGSQIQAIEQGFRALGHEITPFPQEASLVYQNNPWFDGVVADIDRGVLKPGTKVIFNVLDIPEHIPDYDLPRLLSQLDRADAVTCISQFVQGQLARAGRPDVPVIYQPIKPVRRDPAARRQPFYRFAHIGRRHDFNKRAALGVHALQILGYTDRDLSLVGNETGWGDYLGVQSDENLNVIYNSVDFALCTSHIEGLLLPCLEAMAAGAVPVVCSDMTTRTELLPPDLFPEYEDVLPEPTSIARFIATYTNDESGMRLANLRGRLHDHFTKTWADRVSPVGVAQRILDVYHSTT